MHPSMLDYLKALESEGRATTAGCYELGLRNFDAWLNTHTIDPLKVTLSDLQAFVRYLTGEYRSPSGKPLKRHTAATRITSLKMYYRWMLERRLIFIDPATELKTPIIRRQRVACDPLTQQEAAALLEMQARQVKRHREGILRWAGELRNLAMLSLALATGRRRMALLTFRVNHVNFERGELRVEWEKGRPGRVLPCAPWAMNVLKEYLNRGRPRLMRGRVDEGLLFPGNRTARCTKPHLRQLVIRLQRQAAEEHPDLEDLPSKRIGTHGLRVTFATMMFLNGADIRVVNELLMHKKLTTTSRYTPLTVAELKSGVTPAHPRA